ncbi:DUF6668 family protein [Krasilnikovia sp. MM14-A1004]|uniref:DUF6668 family protein n=1 Tax=Krasilnikovia sp. MM14-A1004 TaxID=3373541 RepID=UPI00399D0932
MRANTASSPEPEEGPAAGGMSARGAYPPAQPGHESGVGAAPWPPDVSAGAPHPPRHLHSLPTPTWTQPTAALPPVLARASVPATYDATPGARVSTLPPREPQHRQQGTPGWAAQGICWVAAHGGAGATTLAAAVGGVDVGCRWPDPNDEPARVLLVARTNAGGMRAASQALNAIREGRHPAGMAITGLVLVADAPGRLPRDLVRRIKVLRACVPVWRVPWVPQWRLGKQSERLPSQVVKLGALIPSLQRAELR